MRSCLLLLALFACSTLIAQAPAHHYVASVQGIETSAQERELLHYLKAKDPQGRFVIDSGTGDIDIHTSTFLSEGAFGQAVNAFGLILLHFQEVRPEALPRRKRNKRSA